tara:strand:- start:362 stop:814 length:453 start_codon:yes stop_codon:yes gene_type:complete
MSEWDDNLQGLASELKEARENRDNFIAETEAAKDQFKKEIESQFSELGIEDLLKEMNRILLLDSGTVVLTKSWDETSISDEDDEDEDDENADFISCVLEWFEIDERELAVDLGRDDSGLYLEVNGHEISIEQGALQAALLYAIKEELEFV